MLSTRARANASPPTVPPPARTWLEIGAACPMAPMTLTTVQLMLLFLFDILNPLALLRSPTRLTLVLKLSSLGENPAVARFASVGSGAMMVMLSVVLNCRTPLSLRIPVTLNHTVALVWLRSATKVKLTSIHWPGVRGPTSTFPRVMEWVKLRTRFANWAPALVLLARDCGCDEL